MYLGLSLITLLLHVYQVVSKDLYISNKGEDGDKCTSPIHPCRTLQYAVNVSDWDDIINIDSKTGSYKNISETLLEIRHSLHFTNYGQSPASIDCQQNVDWLINIVTIKERTISLTLSNLVISNCKLPGDSKASKGVIQINNAEVHVKNCTFNNNGALFYSHGMPDNATGKTTLNVQDTIFLNNMANQPLRYAFDFYGVPEISVILTNCNLTRSPISVFAQKELSLDIAMSEINGGAVKGSLVDITLASNTSHVVISNTLVSNHVKSHRSAVSIASNGNIENPNIHFNSVNFFNNNKQKSYGGALSLIGRSNDVSNLNMNLVDCVFNSNSAEEKGGAIYAKMVANIAFTRCNFTSNKATVGGAIKLDDCNSINIIENIFTRNSAEIRQTLGNCTTGGAIHMEAGNLTIQQSSFLNNIATHQGSSVYVSRPSSLYLINSHFHHRMKGGISGKFLTVKYMDDGDRIYTHAIVKLTNCDFVTKSKGPPIITVIDIEAPTLWQKSSVNCPSGHSLDIVNQISQNFEKNIKYSCQQCPVNTYLGDESKCETCPENGICQNGMLFARANYWLGETNSSKPSFTHCPEGHCCIKETDEDCLDSQCNGQWEGLLCGHCAGSYESLSHSCVNGTECKAQIQKISVAFISVVCYAIALILLSAVIFKEASHGSGSLTEQYPEDGRSDVHEDNDDDEELILTKPDDINEGTESKIHSIVKLSFYYVQMAPHLYKLSSVSGTLPTRFVYVWSEIFNLQPIFSAFKGICFESQTEEIVTKFFCSLAVSLLLFVIYVVLSITEYYRSLEFTSYKRLLMKALPFSFTLNFMTTVFTCLSLLSCVSIDNSRVLFIAGDTECFQPWQICMLLTLFLYALPLLSSHFIGPMLMSRNLLNFNQFIAACIVPLVFWTFYGLKALNSRIKFGHSFDREALVDLRSSEPSARNSSLLVISTLTDARLMLQRTILLVISICLISDTTYIVMIAAILLICVLALVINKNNKLVLVVDVTMHIFMMLLVCFKMTSGNIIYWAQLRHQAFNINILHIFNTIFLTSIVVPPVSITIYVICAKIYDLKTNAN